MLLIQQNKENNEILCKFQTFGMSITVFILYVNDLQYARGGYLQILKDIFMFQLI